ncbi:MAG: restriction endonuclease [Thermoanaerobaculia bacterium]
MPNDQDWRDFEGLVALIEEQAAPRGAAVKAPDRIRDMVTGHLREVDASIRFSAGTTEILVTVECRKRSRKGDDTWIEQLATKKQRIGASKTIAVSSAGFTKSALRSARHHGIELRKLSEIRLEDVESWFLPHGVVHLFRSIEKLECRVECDDGSPEVVLDDPMEPVFTHELVHTTFPASIFVNFLELRDPKCFWSAPLDGTQARFNFDLYGDDSTLVPVPLGVPPPEKCQLHILKDGRLTPVRRLRLSVDLSFHVAAFEAKQGVHHAYEGVDRPITQHTQFSGEVFGLPVTFDHQSSGTDQSSASVLFPSGLRFTTSWAGLDKPTFEEVSKAIHGKPAPRTCTLCDSRKRLVSASPVPAYLFPDTAPVPKERLLCSACAERINTWDDYGKTVVDSLPLENFAELEGKCVGLEGVDYPLIRLWLLSLLWRMHTAKAPVWSDIDLGSVADQIALMLATEDPGLPRQFPSWFVIPSFDGRRLSFVLQPDIVESGGVPLVRATLGGLIFLFLIGHNADEKNLYLQPGSPLVIPVVAWREIDFLAHWIETQFPGATKKKLSTD